MKGLGKVVVIYIGTDDNGNEDFEASLKSHFYDLGFEYYGKEGEFELVFYPFGTRFN